MKCSCPWCEKEVVKGKESFFGFPTCEKHDWETILSSVKEKDERREEQKEHG